SVEEMFCFIKVKMPYLCGLWRFANAYLRIIMKGAEKNETKKLKKSLFISTGGSYDINRLSV
ncbi:hypothetical protein OCV51_14270, partial [Faecalicatena acetigenes]